MPDICHITTTFNLESASARRAVIVLKECVSHGCKTTLIIGRDNDVNESDLPGIEIIVIPELLKYVNLKCDVSALFALIHVLKRIKPDIVHTYLAKGGVLGRFAAFFAKVPFIMHTVHGPTFAAGIHPIKRSAYWILEKLCAYVTDLFVFVGEELRQSYIKALICHKNRSTVVYTGRTQSELFRQALGNGRRRELRGELCQKSDIEFLMVAVGRIVPSKQFEHAIEILSRLRNRKINAHLAIVGKAFLKEERLQEKKLMELAFRKGIGQEVHFVGFRNDILDVMDAADVVVMTSMYEGLPNIAVEAAISGTPMVTYSVCGVGEVIESGKTGFIIRNGDIGEMENTLLRLCSDRTFNSKLSRRALEGIQSKFSENAMLAAKMDIYRI